MASVQIMPGSQLLGADHNVSVYFQVSVTVSPAGSVVVEAPQGFDFGNPCTVTDLDSSLYRFGDGSMYATLNRLPRVLGCTGEVWPAGSDSYGRAIIDVARPLLQGTRMGFALRVQNPDSFLLDRQMDWAVYTVGTDGQVVERSSGLAAHCASPAGRGASQAWGLYAQAIVTGVSVNVTYQDGVQNVTRTKDLRVPLLRFGDMTPFLVANRATTVTILPIQFPSNFNATLRFTAPLGFIWETMMPFAAEAWNRQPQGVTQVFPGLFPTVEDEVYLKWSTPLAFRAYDAAGKKTKYGFSFGIRVPWWPQTGNTFYMELGYTDEALVSADGGTRPYVAAMPGPPNIQIIRSAQVDYLTGLNGRMQTVRVLVTTATLLLPGEGFLFRAGNTSASLSCSCPPAQSLPAFRCTPKRAKLTFELLLELVVTGTVVPGPSAFSFACQNPDARQGLMQWTLASYEDPTGYPEVSAVDSEAVVPGFAVQAPLANFTRLPGSPASLADPRPLRRSGTVLAFALAPRNVSVAGSSARLRAPEGTKFALDCLDDVITAGEQVFGSGLPLDNSLYQELPAAYTCRGDQHRAYLRWQQPLSIGVQYVMRVVAVNPESQPPDNVWTLEVDDQSSDLVKAVPIQRFADVTLKLSVPALRLQGSEVGGSGSNRVRLGFTPTLRAQSLSILAAPGYSFGDGAGSDACDGLQLIGRLLPGAAGQGVVVPPMSSCAAFGEALSLNISILPTHAYTLDADILAPVGDTAPHLFRLYSTAVGGGLGDESWVNSPPLALGVASFSLARVAGGDLSLANVTVQLGVAFRAPIADGDTVGIAMPPGFVFAGGLGACPARWLRPEDGPPLTCSCTVDTSTGRQVRRCSVGFVGNQSTLSLNSGAAWPAREAFRLELTVVNPMTVPSTFDNVFQASLSAFGSGAPQSVGQQRGWAIKPPLSGLNLTFAPGSVLRAGAAGATLSLGFVPSNDATVLRLTGQQPMGWNFTRSTICGFARPTGCRQPMATDAISVIQVGGLDLQAGVPVQVQVRGVGLAGIGGNSSFQVQTFIEDQSSNLVLVDSGSTGFWLPGALEVSSARLRTRRGAVQDPADRLWNQLPPRINIAEAAVVWQFTTTQAASAGDSLCVSVVAGPLALAAEVAGVAEVLTASGSLRPVSTRARLVSPSEVTLSLRAPLVAGSVYQGYVAATVLDVLPNSTTTFLNVSVCRSGLPFPVSTNDAVLPGGGLGPSQWYASSALPFSVVAISTAPLTQITLIGTVQAPAQMLVDLIAPQGVVILDPCSPSTCKYVDKDMLGTGQQAAVGMAAGDFRLVINMPQWWTLERNRWVALVRAAVGDTTVASTWGDSSDLQLRLMPAVVGYPAVAGQRGVQLLLSFKVGVTAAAMIFQAAQCFIQVRAPTGYGLRCDLFRVVTLPQGAVATCAADSGGDPSAVLVGIGSVRFTAQDVVLGFGLDVPQETPSSNVFQATVLTASNKTADSNTQIPGLAIPSQRLSCRLAWQVSGFESPQWLQAWVAAATSSGAFADGLASTLQVSNWTISINNISAQMLTARRRLDAAAALRGQLTLVFSVAVRQDSASANSKTKLLQLLSDAALPSTAAANIQMALSEAGISPVTLDSGTISSPATSFPPLVGNPKLTWTSSAAETMTLMGFSMAFRNDTVDVGAILFVLPPGFRHAVRQLGDFQVVGDIPVDVAAGSWIETPRPDTLRVLLAPSANIKVGTYSFQMPAMIPYEMPALNIWYLCLCSSRSCDSPTHPSVTTAFALAGFQIGDPGQILTSTALKWERSLALVVAVALAGLAQTILLD